jgi:hypothetical protein
MNKKQLLIQIIFIINIKKIKDKGAVSQKKIINLKSKHLQLLYWLKKICLKVINKIIDILKKNNL